MIDFRSVTLVLSAGAVALGAAATLSALYLHLRLTRRLQKDLCHLTKSVVELKKEIADLKTLSKRRSGQGSSISDETDVYYDFSDEGDEDDDEDEMFRGLNSLESEEENLRSIDLLLDMLSNKPELYYRVYLQVAGLKEKFFDNANYLWRFARTCHTCGFIAGGNGELEKKKELLYEAMNQASAALALTDEDANVHKWYAITVGSCADFENMQNRIKFGFTFKEHTQIALRLNPDDESLHHLMGRWCYEVAILSWIERKVASTLFSELPTASLSEARQYFLETERLRGDALWKENRLYIAKTYISEGDYASAIEWLDKASEGETTERTDTLVLDEIDTLRKKFSDFRT